MPLWTAENPAPTPYIRPQEVAVLRPLLDSQGLEPITARTDSTRMPDTQRALDQTVALAGAGVGYVLDGSIVAVLLAGFAALVISAARAAGPQIGDAIGRAAGYWILRIARVPDGECGDP